MACDLDLASFWYQYLGMAKRKVDPKVVIAYLRVSTTTERQELGASAQRHAIEQWAEREGVTVAAWYTEEVSGGAPLDKRMVLLEALAAVREHGAARLVVQRLDRFSRDPMSAALAEAELRRHGATLAVAEGAGDGEDPSAQLVRGILLSVARFEKAMIAARIRAALGVKKRRGEKTGAAPFGWKVGSDGKTLEPDEAEHSVVLRVVQLREEFHQPERQIAAQLKLEGFVSRSGLPLSQVQIHRVLARHRALARGRAA
jgi:site-specific DNA recombinase